MNDTLQSLLLTWLCWWVVVFTAYMAVLLAADALLTKWQRHRDARRHQQVEIERINRQTAVAVHRISAAFAVAQQLVRNEAAGRRGQPLMTSMEDRL